MGTVKVCFDKMGMYVTEDWIGSRSFNNDNWDF